MTKSALTELLDFLDFLDEMHMPFQLERHRSTAIMVTFALPGHPVEVEFLEDCVAWTTFRGDEMVDGDMDKLRALILEERGE